MNEPVSAVRTHLRLPFRFAAGELGTRFSDAMRRGEIYGNRCATCSRTYVPPRATCAHCWERCVGWKRVADEGAISTFVVVNVPFYGQEVEIPYVLAHVLLDGADSPILHLVGTVGESGKLSPPADTQIGMRVRAVWRDERTGFISEDIDHFEPVS
jgi:uncharacterized OB-fold protein